MQKQKNIQLKQQILLVLINKIYYQSWNCILLSTGAKYQPSIKYYFQFFRLITPIFLHQSFMHLLGNLIFQICLGFNLEKYYSSFKYAMTYFISGIGGNLLSCCLYDSKISVGASGALFGLFALQIAYFYETRENWNQKKAGIIIFAILLIWNIVFTFIGKDIDIVIEQFVLNNFFQKGAHLGGFLVGLFITCLITNSFQNLVGEKDKLIALFLFIYFLITFLLTFLLKPITSSQLALLELGCSQLFYGAIDQN